jgi:hypothetical protein
MFSDRSVNGWIPGDKPRLADTYHRWPVIPFHAGKFSEVPLGSHCAAFNFSMNAIRGCLSSSRETLIGGTGIDFCFGLRFFLLLVRLLFANALMRLSFFGAAISIRLLISCIGGKANPACEGQRNRH